ncbi:MAG: 3-deoxy-D-manno-octulosonic acid transferase [Caulobacterales bacterium]|jgi:3-deoxy-D-manno-octulosonic-acid transferase
MKRYPPALSAYRMAARALGVLAGPVLTVRAAQGKEDQARRGERFGRASAARPSGCLVWLHAASVGEAGVALQIRAGLAGRVREVTTLITTGTRTSAALVDRAAPANTIHQYAPLDRPDCAKRFIAHWRPDLGVFVESELWPNLILTAQEQGTALALVNARMSPKSLADWAKVPTSAKRLLAAFDVITTADARTAEGLITLGARRAARLGNVKFAAPAPPIDVHAHTRLMAQIAKRPVWLAASTHAGEDEIVLAAHEQLRRGERDALLIIAPRHPERGAQVAELAGGAPRRSQNQPIGDAAVYVADTLGEMGTLYAAAPVALVAGSLRPELKGHNPMEPAKIGAAILSGPHVESFDEAFEALLQAGGARIVEGPARIAATVDELWRDEPARQRLTQAAGEIAGAAGPALAATIDALEGLLGPRTTTGGGLRARA